MALQCRMVPTEYNEFSVQFYGVALLSPGLWLCDQTPSGVFLLVASVGDRVVSQ